MNKFRFDFTLIQHTPIIHHLGKETWSGLQSKAITPMLNRFLVEKKTRKKGEEAEKAFKDMFRTACGICGNKGWNAGACTLSLETDEKTGKCEAGKKGGCKYAGWFRNKKELESLAFNYILSFECKVDEKAWYTGKTMMQERAHILYENRQVHGSISYSSKDLFNFIWDSLSEFFILTGFGYNSSKGFGCFTLAATKEKDIKEVLHKHYYSGTEAEKSDKIVFYHDINEQEVSMLSTKQLLTFCKSDEEGNSPKGLNYEELRNYKEKIKIKFKGSSLIGKWKFENKMLTQYPKRLLLNDEMHNQIEISEKLVKATNYYFSSLEQIITNHWKLIKSGTNQPYYKSLLWEYFCGENGNAVGWEKRFIKEALKENCLYDFNQLKRNPRVNNGEMRFETTDNAPGNFQFFRLLLGLAEKYEYRLREGVRINDKNEISISVKPKNKNIERIPSPVKFKVFFDTIFIVVDSVNEILRDSLFEFYYKGKALDFNGINSLGIQIPQLGLRECFESILLNTAKYNKPGEQHPICNKYQQLTAEDNK